MAQQTQSSKVCVCGLFKRKETNPELTAKEVAESEWLEETHGFVAMAMAQPRISNSTDQQEQEHEFNLVSPLPSPPFHRKCLPADLKQKKLQMNEIRDSESISDDAESELQHAEPSGAGVKSANGCPDLVNQIETMLKKLETPPSDEFCIYKVPESLRNVNKQSYTPRVVSIGPFHYSDERLKPTEALKKRYLKSLVDKSKKEIREYVQLLKSLEEEARNCYAETINMTSDAFVLMMLVDAGFILELLLRFNKHARRLTPWLESAIYNDILLLENQIPFFVLEGMFTIANDTTKVNGELLNLTLKMFQMHGEQATQNLPFTVQTSLIDKPPIHHLADLKLILYRPTAKKVTPKNIFQSAYSVTELHQAGVKFVVSSSSHLLDVKFEKGVLEIPFFRLEDTTETSMRNLMALELCHYPSNSFIIDYIIFMDGLINTSSDIDILVRNKIIVNLLGESKVAADLFNKLGVNVTFYARNYYFSQICEDLKAHYEAPLHTWIATCRRDYFSSPWKSASTIAAITLLVLTFIQTVFSILAFTASKPSF